MDVPSLDAVIFVHQRSSPVDITQAVGRAMRKAPGKKKGYIVIPVVVPEGVSAQEMLKASDFNTVWDVVRALRSHDSRMNYYISNRSSWLKNAPLIFRQSSLGQKTEDDDIDVGFQQKLALQLSQEIASKVVDTIGDKQMYPRWGKRAADICRQVQTLVKQLVTGGGAERAFERFLKGIRRSIGDHITREQAQEMIAQHVVTIPVFDVMLAGSGFAAQNPVSQEIERLLETFQELGVSFEEELRPLTRAYQQMEAAFEGAVTSAEKVDILREIYDGFFKAAMKNIVKRVGIVYTPVQIVDFMVRSAAAICQKEFGRSIGSENLHILDPFAGTGTFLARLIEMKDEDGNYLIAPEDLDRKYKEELHANELILLAYYIAAIKIEEAKHSRDIESDGATTYERYRKILLSDTFLESPSQAAFPAFQDNIRGRLEQDATPMTVILANPPWSSGQKDAGDDNPNLEYEDVGNRVEQTYGAKHREVTGRAPGGNAAGNLYVKALRWCSDRVLPNTQRGDHPAIIGLVHPNSLTDGTSLAGVRATLRDEYTDIYVINLRGNAFKQGDERQREGDPVFGEGTRNGTQITFLVRNPSKNPDQPATLHYAQVPDYMSLDQKWVWLENVWDIISPLLEKVPVTSRHDWINLSDGTFEELLPICDTDKKNPLVAFTQHARGVGTSCDFYVYSFDRQTLIEKVKRLIDAYEDALDWYEDYPRKDVFDEATANDRLDEIKWTTTLKTSLKQRKDIIFDVSRIREVLYRPFTKLYLYEDDRILSAVKTVSAMFPRDEEEQSVVERGGGWKESSSPAHPIWPSSEYSLPGSTEISRPQERPRPAGSSSGGDSDYKSGQRCEGYDDGNKLLIGSAYNVGNQHGAGDTAPQVTGGGGIGDPRHRPIQQGGLRSSRDRGRQRPLRSRNPSSLEGRPQTAILMTGPSNMATFGVLAADLLPDLHTMAAGQQTRTIPRRR